MQFSPMWTKNSPPSLDWRFIFEKPMGGGFAGFPNLKHLKYPRLLYQVWSGLKESPVGSGLSVFNDSQMGPAGPHRATQTGSPDNTFAS